MSELYDNLFWRMSKEPRERERDKTERIENLAQAMLCV